MKLGETTRPSGRTFVRANLLQTCCGLVVYVADLLQGSRRGTQHYRHRQADDSIVPIANRTRRKIKLKMEENKERRINSQYVK